MTKVFYTDGSITRQPLTGSLSASWAFVMVEREKFYAHSEGQLEAWRSGFVVTNPFDSCYLGASRVTNNTAELSGIYWAMYWTWWSKLKEATIYSDSAYAVHVCRGQAVAQANREMVKLIRSSLLQSPGVKLRWIKGHAGMKFNELADRFAKAQLHE
jgi:ribonuclease HI